MKAKFTEQHAEIIAALRAHPVVSIFQMTDTQGSLICWDQLETAGVIVRQDQDPRDVYPYCVFAINERKLEEVSHAQPAV